MTPICKLPGIENGVSTPTKIEKTNSFDSTGRRCVSCMCLFANV